MVSELFIIGILGLIIGSFLNVFILRLNTGRSTSGRSGCMSCGEKLSWTELIPIFSFFALHGRCKKCGSAISNQYWLVELTTSILFVLVWVQGFELYYTVLALILVSLLIVIAVYDIKHTIIPNNIVYSFILLALFSSIPILSNATVNGVLLNLMFAIVSGILVASPLLLLWLISRGKWIGFGDVKLTLGFGFILGTYGGLTAIMLGFILGAIIGLLLIYSPKIIQKVMKYIPWYFVSGRFTMSSEVPFAPFLILGFLLVFLLNVDILTFINIFV